MGALAAFSVLDQHYHTLPAPSPLKGFVSKYLRWNARMYSYVVSLKRSPCTSAVRYIVYHLRDRLTVSPAVLTTSAAHLPQPTAGHPSALAHNASVVLDESAAEPTVLATTEARPLQHGPSALSKDASITLDESLVQYALQMLNFLQNRVKSKFVHSEIPQAQDELRDRGIVNHHNGHYLSVGLYMFRCARRPVLELTSSLAM